MADSVDVFIRLHGARRFQAESTAASTSLGQVEVSAHRGNRALAAIGRGAALAGKATLGLGVLGVATGIKYNAAMEKSRIGLTRMMGSQKAAMKLQGRLLNLEQALPILSAKDAMELSMRLKSSGMEADKLVPTLTSLADATAATGGGAEELKGVTVALNQMRTQGRISTQELNQMSERNVPAFQILRKEMGLTGAELRDQLQAGSIGAEKGTRLLLRGFSKEYGGAAKAQGKSFSGLMSNLQAGIQRATGALTKPLYGALKRYVLPAAIDLTTEVRKWAEGGGMKRLIEQVRTFAKGKGLKTAKQGFSDLKDALDNVRPVAEAAWGILKKVMKIPYAKEAALVVGGFALAMKGANKATGGMVVTTGKLGVAMLETAGNVTRLVTQIIAYKTAQLLSKGATAASTSATVASTAATSADNTMVNRGIVARSRAVVSLIAQRVAQVAAFVATTALTVATGALNVVMSLNPVTLVVIALVALVAGLIIAYKKSDAFRKIVNAVWKAVKIAAMWIGEKAVEAFKLLWRILKLTPLGFVISHLKQIVQFIRTLPGKISKAAGGMWDGIKDAFRGAINFIIRGWNGLDFSFNLPDFLPGVPDSVTVRTPNIAELAAGGLVRSRGSALVGERGPELLTLPAGARVDPLTGPSVGGGLALAGGGSTRIEVPVYLDRRQIGLAVTEYAADRQANR